MANIKTSLIKFFFSYDWGIIEIQGAMSKIVWGIWLLMPFPVFRSISGYTAIATENYWGYGLLVIGICHLATVTMSQWNIFPRTSLRLRQGMTLFAVFFWSFTVYLIGQQAPTSALLPFFALIAVFMLLNWLRLGVETKNIRDRRNQDVGAPLTTGERRSP